MTVVEIVSVIIAGAGAIALPMLFALAVPKNKKRAKFTVWNVAIMMVVTVIIVLWFINIK